MRVAGKHRQLHTFELNILHISFIKKIVDTNEYNERYIDVIHDMC